MIRFILGIFSLYSPTYPRSIVYMLQSVEYLVKPYLKWFWRTDNFFEVAKRRQLVLTGAAKLLEAAMILGMVLHIATVIFLYTENIISIGPAIAAFISYPILWAHLITVPLILGRILIIEPKQKKLIARSRRLFSSHQATIIAVAGSYGKTSMKEILATVLSESMKVAATPANKNVATSHAYFAESLTGNEEVLVIEYGEGEPGDVSRFASTTRPNIGIITGLAPAHLDRYPTLEDAGRDIFSLADYLNDENVYVNAESPAAAEFTKPQHHKYSVEEADGWQINNVTVGYDGTRFEMKKGSIKLKLHSALLGRHQVGPLALAVAIGIKLGMKPTEVESGIAKTVPFEHRLQPRIISGAWILDDTYNGNIDGIRAGLKLLSELPADRKIYVTPGLVDQGIETENVHLEMGRLIAEANPEKIVLMKNSVTGFIKAGLERAGYDGEVSVEDDPLAFYTNLDLVVAAGDLVLMQNDWTDNYA